MNPHPDRGANTRWNPTQYLAYADLRVRPALELLARVALDEPREIVDLGCGPGNVTRLLAERWPEARVLGIDHSEEMIARARVRHARAGRRARGADAAQSMSRNR